MNPLIAKIIKSEETSNEELFTQKGRIYSFLNPVSYLKAKDCLKTFSRMDGLFADGNILAMAIRRKYRVKISRRSFDMTSLAKELFEYTERNGKELYLVGGTESDIEQSVNIIRHNYPKIKIAGAHHGYFDDNPNTGAELQREIIKLNPDYVIVGMGVCRQELFLDSLQSGGFKGIGFTCGGFFSQLAESGIEYYPKFIDRLNLRFIYRFIKEPHTRERYLSSLFLFPLKFLKDAY